MCRTGGRRGGEACGVATVAGAQKKTRETAKLTAKHDNAAGGDIAA
jgi:hypothetical protein